MASKAKSGWIIGARFHLTVVAKYNEVAKPPWQRSWCFQQMWPDVFPRGLVSMEGDSPVPPDLFYYPDAVQHITHSRSKTQLVLVKIQLSVIRTRVLIFPEEQTQVWCYYPDFSGLGCGFA